MTHPPTDEIEVTVFGPGFGEAVLVHIGNRKWISIDCCVDRNTKVNAPLNYLREIGVAVETELELVIASHWHDDHIRGLCDLFEAARTARFCCSPALTSSEFVAFAAAHRKDLTANFSGGTAEMYKILNLIKLENRKLQFAAKDRILRRVSADQLAASTVCEVFTLSPSDNQFAMFLADLGRFIEEDGVDRFRDWQENRNNVAVVCQINFGDNAVLLGSDLENARNDNFGWTSIVESDGRPRQRSKFFKVPHHGSSNGHHDGVWQHMLLNNVYAVVTPYEKLRHPLPTAPDRERLRGLTNFAFITSDHKNPKFSHSDKDVTDRLKEIGAVVEQSLVAPGRVTFRWKCGVEPTIILSQMARPLV